MCAPAPVGLSLKISLSKPSPMKARTTTDNTAFWLEQARRYEEEAARHTGVKKQTWLARAAGARAHAETTKRPL